MLKSEKLKVVTELTELELRLIYRALHYCPCQCEEMMPRANLFNKLDSLLKQLGINTAVPGWNIKKVE